MIKLELKHNSRLIGHFYLDADVSAHLLNGGGAYIKLDGYQPGASFRVIKATKLPDYKSPDHYIYSAEDQKKFKTGAMTFRNFIPGRFKGLMKKRVKANEQE